MTDQPVLSRVFSAFFVAALGIVDAGLGVCEEPSSLTYLSNDVLAGAIIRPADLLRNRQLTDILKKSQLETILIDELDEMGDVLDVNVRQMEEFAILFDESMVKQILGIRQKRPVRNSLKQIGLAFHNYHDVYRKFVDDDGIEDDGNKGNLSWRVHLLPFLEEAQLYQKFNLDEPWDSENNKALIDRMPEIFRSPGVDDPTKTSLHVFTGPGTPFEEDRAPGIRDFTDGTSNTILALMAGPETAEVWTRPGGLDVDPAHAIDEIGLKQDPLQAVFADGSSNTIAPGIDPTILQHLIEYQDGHVVDFEDPVRFSRRSPILFLRSSDKLRKSRVLDGLLGESHITVKKEVHNLIAHTSNGQLVVFPDDHTFIAGPDEAVTAMVAKPAEGPLFGQLRSMPDGEVRFGGDISSIGGIPAGRRPPFGMNMMFGAQFIGKVKMVSGHIDLAGSSENLAGLTLGTENAKDGAIIGALAQGLVQIGKAQLMAAATTGQLPFDEDELKPLNDLIDQLSVKTDAEHIHVQLPRPNMDRLINDFAPLLDTIKDMMTVELQRQKTREEQQGIRQMLLAFHNHHDVHLRFPNHNAGADGEEGLSWRVHLLPYLGDQQLHNRFHFDEPWDSDHNKPLIEQMPDVYSVKGVDKPGHTTYHVFVGDDAPFPEEGDGPRIRDFTDGTSNTLLVVRAGPETAAPWTKPGGIEFTGEDILERLGTIGERLLFGRCDGSSGFVDVDELDDSLLKDFITPAGGEVLRAF